MHGAEYVETQLLMYGKSPGEKRQRPCTGDKFLRWRTVVSYSVRKELFVGFVSD